METLCTFFCFSLKPKMLLKKESLLKQKKAFLCAVSSEPGQIMMSHVSGCFQELPDRSNCDNSLGMGLFGDLKPSLPPPVASRLQIFTTTGCCQAVIFQGYYGGDEMGIRIEQVKMPYSSVFSWRFSHIP